MISLCFNKTILNCICLLIPNDQQNNNTRNINHKEFPDNYRVSKKKLTPFKFKLAGNLLLEFDNSISLTITMHFNSHRELDLCFRLINGSPIWYALYTPEIFRQLLLNYSRYAANLNMNAIRFFLLTLYNLCALTNIVYVLLQESQNQNTGICCKPTQTW